MSSSSDHRARVLRGRAARHAKPALLDAVAAVPTPPEDAVPAAPSVADAWSEGWAAGFEAGAQAAAARADEAEAARRLDVGRALGALEAAAAGWHEREVTALRDVEDAVVDAALALAAAVVERELATGSDALSRALRLAPTSGPFTVRLHPDDLAVVECGVPAADGREPVLVPDPLVGRGGYVLEVGDRTVDGRLDAALARAREAMRP